MGILSLPTSSWCELPHLWRETSERAIGFLPRGSHPPGDRIGLWILLWVKAGSRDLAAGCLLHPSKADIGRTFAEVRFVPQTDSCIAARKLYSITSSARTS